ncbi:MAG: branched-chain amino acid transaminase [Verrucomicrobia bacterium]|nr:branched-chain amino acid transaminase [Verrucomicrobiota bacterium]
MTFGAGKIWMDGKLVDWQDATISVMSHVVHYGSAVFEGIRCYETPNGPAIFRLGDHVRRLYDSAKIYRMPIPFTPEQFSQAIVETVKVNNLKSCYIRPLVYRGYAKLGVNPLDCPVNSTIAVWSWGKYLGEEAMEKGVSVRVSSWHRPAPKTFPALAKASGNYLNSQLIRMEAMVDGYEEGIALDHYGFVSEGSGENIFIVRNGVIYTPPSSNSILPGITRHCVFQLAREAGIRIHQQVIPREALYIADEVFFSGTAAEITPVRKIDHIEIGTGRRGPVTEKIQSEFFKIVNGAVPDRHKWFTMVT